MPGVDGTKLPIASDSLVRCVTRKQTLRSLSLSYQKKVRVAMLILAWHQLFRIWVFLLHRSYSLKVCGIPKQGWARPSFFWYDNDKDLKVCFLVTCVLYQVVCVKLTWTSLTTSWSSASAIVLTSCLLITLLKSKSIFACVCKELLMNYWTPKFDYFWPHPH